jgi:hypothetical protein
MAEAIHALDLLQEEVFTSDEVAKLMKLHPSTIRKMFVDEPGVLRFGHPGDRGRSQYFSLRIPSSVVERVLTRMLVPSSASRTRARAAQ